MNDSYEMDTATSDTYGSKNKSNTSKRPKVYSAFIQKDHNNQSQHRQQQPDATYIKYNQKFQQNIVKKPKYNSNTHLQETRNTKKSFNEDQDMLSHSQEEIDPITETVIGLNTFYCENVFPLDKNHLLISLDCKNKSKKNSFCFKGKCSIAMIHGHLGITGFNLKNSSIDSQSLPNWHDLYSPETNSFLSITNKQNPESHSENLDIDAKNHAMNKLSYLIQVSINQEFTEPMIQQMTEFLFDISLETSSLFILRNLNSHVCNYLNYIDNFKQIYQVKSTDALNDIDSRFYQLGVYPISLQSYQATHRESDEEKVILNEIMNFKNESDNGNKFQKISQDSIRSKSPIVMACGGKDVGKSTFLRYMVNSFLEKYKFVAYLDCDPGQCEYTLGGCLSLTIITKPILGPPHTHINHNNSTKSCFFFGHLSPSDTPGLYLQCIKKCQIEYEKFIGRSGKNEIVPLVVNTMGWNQGLGLCLLKDIVLLFNPTHIIQINHSIEANKNMPTLDKSWLETQEAASPQNKFKKQNKPEKNREEDFNEHSMTTDSSSSLLTSHISSLYSHINYKLLTLKSKVPVRSPKILIQQKRYSAKDHRNIGILSYFSLLQDPKGYFESIHNLRPYKISWSKFGLHCSHAKIEYNQLFRVFNASLVGLCVVDQKHIIKNPNNLNLPGTFRSYDSENKEPVVYTCSGFGIIRGINMETREFYILTPENPQFLEKVNLLVKGMLSLPYEFFYEQDAETNCPYMSISDSNQENIVGNEPVQRKYLVHQTHGKTTN